MPTPKSTRVLVDPEPIRRPFVDTRPAAPEIEVDEPGEEADAREDARAQGYREGRIEAQAELERELDGVRREAASALSRLANLEQQITRRHEELLLEIALEASSRILRQRLESADPVAARALAEALDTLPASSCTRVRLNPADLEPVADGVRAEIDAGRIELIADARVSPGGASVESDVGTVDATLETAVESVRSAALGDDGLA